ncbi:DUF4367 domain-containing protein [Niallia sp. NCCP-28]|uniref:DUF4367 domain-containing protein n=1 Tax=Niallia sp. NCCP-28 TaxID=2934712 RepID=UPI0020886C66|nr:DUF4367 domain-containing protein [Niallia sp. NCCP-28]GKU80955.1 hypothetical protein NCCP28_03510 [Niallia sp. NCCP-28]
MKRRNADADFDSSLRDLDTHFIWKKKQKQELKGRIFSDIENLEFNKMQVKLKEKKRYPQWIIGSVASLLIVGVIWTLGGTYITEATNTFISQIFGSKEKLLETFPDEGENLSEIERHFELAKEQLTKQEFADYKRLIKEQTEILDEMAAENRLNPTVEEEKRIEEIQKEGQKYEKRITALTTHTLEEAQKMVSYPINRPSYLPEGYELESEEARTKEMNIGKDPIVEFQYRGGTNGEGFRTTTQKIGQNKEGELEPWKFEHINSYTLKGFKFEFAYDDGSNVQGMRIAIPEEGYEITIIADILSKEEMEKILLSMVE